MNIKKGVIGLYKEYYVAKNGSDNNVGSKKQPFLTINHAAQAASPGDTIFVHEGVYREWVAPVIGGLDNYRRITFQAVTGGKVVIKGSEEIKNWELVKESVWKATLDNQFFGDFNPYKEEVFGDWLVREDYKKHLGDVYLNGLSFYEANAYEDLFNAKLRTEVIDHWTETVVPIVNPDQTKYVWYAEVTDEFTTIYANFHDVNPNENCVEINVRKSCFSPKKMGVNYVTLRGFEICHAASPWTPPTADQVGMVGPNWSKGWIIENNILHDAKCSAISIGKEGSTGHNHHSIRFDKTGHQYQLEAVFLAQQIGWKKETIGSHIIRNNTIYDCGQNGIVGHLGCAFSTIEHNHIYNIALKREFYGYEIAGIKLHAPIDVVIRHNRIHDCSLGTWLDWQTQGTRIHKNIYYNNSRDFFVEVSHGPYVVDHNIFASPAEFDNFAQGGAYLHNIFCGPFRIENVLDRATPYHFANSTDVAGFSFVYSGDDRFLNNVFIQTDEAPTNPLPVGTAGYKGYSASFEAYQERMRHEHKGLWEETQHVTINNNAYFGGALTFEEEQSNFVYCNFHPQLEIEEANGEVYVTFSLPDRYDARGDSISSEMLGHARIVGAPFTKPDGSAYHFNTDFFGETRKSTSTIGPFQNVKSGTNRFRVW